MVSNSVNKLAVSRRTTPSCRQQGIKVKIFVNVAVLLATIPLKVKDFVNVGSGQGGHSPLCGSCFSLQVRTYVNVLGANAARRSAAGASRVKRSKKFER